MVVVLEIRGVSYFVFFIFNRNQKSSKQNPILQIVTQRHHHHRRSALRENPSHPNGAVHLQHPIYPLKRRNQTIMKIASKRKIVINMAKHPHRGQVNVVEIVLIAMKSRSSILSLPTWSAKPVHWAKRLHCKQIISVCLPRPLGKFTNIMWRLHPKLNWDA